jgi:hypothetical protein
MNWTGRALIIAGLILLAAGVLISVAPALINRISALTNLFSAIAVQKITSNLLKLPTWLGRLPGDITFKRDNFSFYFPLGTCLLLSAILSFIMWLLRK